jgi:hypothetical protein
MSKSQPTDLTEAKRIAARMLTMKPEPHSDSKLSKAKPGAGNDPKKRKPKNGAAR